MAVVDKYVNADLEAGGYATSSINGGSSQSTPIVVTFEVAAGDDDGSVYRLFRINSQNSLAYFHFFNDAITGGTDYDIGLYETVDNGGAAVDADLFLDGGSMATASTANQIKDAMGSVDRADYAKSVAELLGLTRDPNKEYDVAITGNTVGTAAGTITVRALIA